MIKFEEYEFLLNYICIISEADFRYAEDELDKFLKRNASNISNEPIPTFTLEFDNIKYTISVTSKNFNNPVYQKYYWIVDINLPGETWGEVKHILTNYLWLDESNFDENGKGILEFCVPYSNFYVEGTLLTTDNIPIFSINDNNIIYKNL